jgi:hypothetical protein
MLWGNLIKFVYIIYELLKKTVSRNEFYVVQKFTENYETLITLNQVLRNNVLIISKKQKFTCCFG